MGQCLPELDYTEFTEFLGSQIFTVQDMLLVDEESYSMYFKKFYTYMKQGFEIREVRTYPVKFKFTSNDAELVRSMQIRHLIINMIFWHPFLRMDRVTELNSAHIVDCSHLTGSYINDWVNTYIIDPYRKMYSNKKMNRMIAELFEKLAKISNDFNDIMGMSINMKSFIDLSNECEEFDDLIRTKLDPNMQPRDIEIFQHEKMNQLIHIMKTHKNCLQPMLLSGVGIKDKQLSEFACTGGLKPDVNGNTIPIPITSNFLIHGLNTVSNYYIDSQAGRKSIILNKTSMGTSGFFSTKCMILASTVKLSKSVRKIIKRRRKKKHRNEDNSSVQTCNSRRPLIYDVKSDASLKKINRRYYYLDPSMSEMLCVNYKKDKWLIGKTIYLRSPMTCTCEDGICVACYGDLAYTNSEKDFNNGAFASAIMNNKIEQDILSTKHLLTTNSEKLVFSEDFYRFFILEANKFRLNPDSDENFDDWIIRIYNEDLFEFNAKEENDFNTAVDTFHLINKKTKEDIVISEQKKMDMFIYSDIIALFEKSKSKDGDVIEMPLNKISDSDDSYIAMIVVENNELTRPLKNIMKLLDRKGHYDCVTIDQLVNKMSDLLIECGHKLSLVHAECVMRPIIRDIDNIMLQPHFDDIDKTEDYQILTVSSALLNNPSLTVSLSFQDLGKQVVNPNTNIKCEKSSYDDLYRVTL